MTINYCVTCGSPMETRVLDGLERRVCASESCGAVHWGNYSIGVGALVFRDGKILLVRRAQEPGKGNWTNPGGYIEQHEDIGTTVAREVMEETGVEAKVKSIIALRDQPRSIHNVYIAFEMEYVGGEPTPDGVEVDAAGFLHWMSWRICQSLASRSGFSMLPSISRAKACRRIAKRQPLRTEIGIIGCKKW